MDGDVNTLTLDMETMEKSFNDSKDALNALLGDEPVEETPAVEPTEELDKSKKEDEPEVPKNAEDEDEEDEDEDVEKSLSDSVASDPEAEAAMDIEPFLKALVTGLNDKFESLEKKVTKKLGAVSKSLNKVEGLAKAQAQMAVASADLQKAMSDTVEKIGETPVPSGSVLRKGGDRFDSDTGEDKGLDMSKDDILNKALALARDGKLDPMDVTKIEGRLNKGMELEPGHVELLRKAE